MSFGTAPLWEYALIPLVVAAILALMHAVRLLAARTGTGAEVQRKIVHVAVGLSALAFPLVFSGPGPVFALMAVAILVMLALRRSERLGAVLHSVERPSYGEVYMALVIALLFFRGAANPVLYVLPVLVITLSDSASALVGTAYGRMRFPVEDGHKSVEGVVAFFMVTVIVSMSVLLLMTDAGRLNVILLAFMIAAFCALVEADSWRGLDNLFVPAGAHLLLARHLYTDPSVLLALAGVFALVVFAALRYAHLIGLTRHAARAYVILVFLILSVVTPINALLPIVAIAAHLVARRLNPCRSRRPDLDLLAASTGAALLWLLVGESAQLTAINLFNATFAGVASAFVLLAVRGETSAVKLSLGAAAVAGIAALCVWVVMANPADSRWYGEAYWPVLGSVALVALAVLAWPRWFEAYRSPKAFAVAAAPPAAFMLYGAMA